MLVTFRLEVRTLPATCVSDFIVAIVVVNGEYSQACPLFSDPTGPCSKRKQGQKWPLTFASRVYQCLLVNYHLVSTIQNAITPKIRQVHNRANLFAKLAFNTGKVAGHKRLFSSRQDM